ncbi:MAG: chemotaxis protein CheX [Huintestinicola sp.]
MNAAQLSDALAAQKQTRVKLGVLAINAGYMTAEQVDMVHAAQQRMDKRIGDIACEMGFLTEDKVMELLKTQGAAHLQLGQALVDSGAMTNAQFADALNSYKAENSLTDVDFADESGTKINDIIANFYRFDSEENGELITEYVTLLFKNIIRFIGDDFTPLAPERLPSAEVSIAAVQKTSGAFTCSTVFEAVEQGYIGFASRYAGETLTEADEMADASCGEFLNLHNGLFCVNVSNEKQLEIKLAPQEYIRDTSISGTVYRIPLVFPYGTVNFMIIV